VDVEHHCDPCDPALAVPALAFAIVHDLALGGPAGAAGRRSRGAPALAALALFVVAFAVVLVVVFVDLSAHLIFTEVSAAIAHAKYLNIGERARDVNWQNPPSAFLHSRKASSRTDNRVPPLARERAESASRVPPLARERAESKVAKHRPTATLVNASSLSASTHEQPKDSASASTQQQMSASSSTSMSACTWNRERTSMVVSQNTCQQEKKYAGAIR
jgi:hypothetical protein